MQALLYNVAVVTGCAGSCTVTNKMLYVHGYVQWPLIAFNLSTTESSKQYIACVKQCME